jgi:hypothetical protein
MQIKSKTRKAKPGSENGAHPTVPEQTETPPAESNATMSNDNDGANSEAEAGRKPKKRKKAAPSLEKSARESIRTVKDRLKELPGLPSLESSPPPPDVDALSEVDANAAPPPAPAEALEPEPLPSNLIDRGSPIPENYAMDRLVILTRDPNWLYCYWELKGGALERLRFQHSAEVIDNSRWVLRVRGLKDMTHYLVDVDLRVGQWYLKVAPNSRFTMELGFINQQGDFICVVRGNEAHTPNPAVSNVMDERWGILRDDLEKLLKTGGADTLGVRATALGHSEAAPRLIRSEQPRALGLFSSHSFVNPSKEQER